MKKKGLSSSEVSLRLKKMGDNHINYFSTLIWSILKTTVIRNGKKTFTNNNLIVPGDIVILEKNKIVPADIRLLEVDNLSVNQSALNGSEDIVYKNSNSFHSDYKSIFSIKNMVYAGSTIAYGGAVGIVVATGNDTQIAKTEKPTLKKSRKYKKLNKILKAKEIIMNETQNYKLAGSIDTVIINFPVTTDTVKEFIRVFSHQMGKNLIVCTEQAIAKRILTITPGMAHIDKKYFKEKSNKALMEADYPLMCFIDVGEADILRFNKKF